MSNFKRFLSAVMAFVMAFGMLTCLGSVVASAAISPPTVVDYSFKNKNQVTDVFYRGYRNGSDDWQAVTAANFDVYNAAYQNYNDGFGIKSYEDLCDEYGDDPFIYYGIEVLESDGELTDHYVEPGDELTLRAYCKSNVYITGFNAVIMGSRRFFDFNGPTYTAKGFWSSSLDKQGDGLNNTGYTAMAMKAPDAINDLNPMITDDVTGGDDPETTIEISPKTISQHSGMTVGKTGLDASLLNSLDYYLATVSIGNIGRYEGLYAQTDEWLFDWIITVRTESEPYQKPKANASASSYGRVNPFDTDSDGVNDYLIGDLGIDINSCSNVTNGQRAQAFNCVLDADTDAADEDNSYNLGVVVDMTGCDHVFKLGEAPSGPIVVPHTVTYTVDGETYATQSYAEGATITAPAEPTKEGYTFVGWSDGTNTYTSAQVSAMTMGSSNLSFTAVFQENAPVTHTVTWVFNNGTSPVTETLAVGSSITPPAAPEKTGYEFIGWDNIPATMPSQDITITAQWEAIDYTVTFNPDNGEAATVQTYNYGDAITAPAAPVKTGYTFAGWGNVPATMPAENLEFTAQWTADDYTVTFNPDNGEAATVQTYNYGDAITAPADPVKTGYTFAGWGNVPATMPAENLEFTAQWEAIDYTVTWILNNGEDDIVDTYNYGDAINAPEDPEMTGYNFTGWDPANIPDAMGTQNLEFTAQWEAIDYTVTWVFGNGDENQVDTYNYEDEINIPADPERTGYNFTGWDPAVIPDAMGTQNLVFTAQWEAIDYTVTWVFGNGDANQVDTYNYEDTIVPPADPEWAGHNFNGWGANVPYTMPANDLTFTAQWDTESYTITYYVDGEIYDTQTYAFGAEVTGPQNPEKEGYEFTGWDDDLPATMPAENLEFNALFEAKEYTVAYYAHADDTGVYEEYNVVFGEDIDVPDDPETDGYTFAGWLESTDNKAPDEYENGMPASDLVFYGQWEAIDYTVTWVLNNGENDIVQTCNIGDEIDVPADPEMTGYTFAGWDPSDIPQVMGTEDLVFEAQWNAIDYTVTWILNNGEDDIVDTYNYGDAINAPEDPEMTGYNFTGWDPADIPEAMPAENLEFAAQWEAIDYTVTWIFGNGDEDQVDTYNYEDAIDVPADPERTGYDFIGWDPAVPDAMGTEDLVFTAQYEAIDYTVTWNLDNGDDPIVQHYIYEQAIVAPADPEKTGYTFAGWGNVPATMPAESIEFTAQWNVNNYTITWVLGNGEDNIVETYAYEAAVTAIEDPSWTGHTFTGWDEDVPKTMPAEDIILTAAWTVNEYTITYDPNNGGATFDVTVSYGDTITDPERPEAPEGYYFDKWNYADGDGVAYTGSTIPAFNLFATANYRRSVYVESAVADKDTVIKGEYITWTVVTSKDVEYIKLTGRYTVDGANKSVTVMYKNTTTSANVKFAEDENTRTWTISQKASYTGEVDSVLQNYTVYYKVAGESAYIAYNDEPIAINVYATAAAVPDTTVYYEPYTVVSAAGPESATVGQYGTLTIVTTSDCDKVRIGYDNAGKMKYTTYQTTSKSNVSYTDDDQTGLRTWTINYKFATDATQYTVQGRGPAWNADGGNTFTVAFA
ncbi:MAG: InlB B-repeat-containing protein [Clostridia bacterium]|nr:InlB B-repeat-containing protein [Clostridia bacterium]